jgi:hypothetical protein
MAFTDPVVLNLGFGDTNVPRVSTGENRSTYLSGDGRITLKAEHAYARRTRRVIRVDTNKITADPFIPSQNTKVSMSVYTVFDLPPAGYTAAEALAAYAGTIARYTADDYGIIKKLLGGES